MNRPLSWRSPKTVVADSPIHGRGLFARAAIAVDEVVAVKGGYIYDAAAWQAVSAELAPSEIQVGEELFMAVAHRDQWEGAMLFTNHSCEPNIAIAGQIVFVAMRDIAPGEELVHDWATTDNADYRMTCRCGTASCRGTISGQDWREPALRERYRGWFCWHIQRLIDAEG